MDLIVPTALSEKMVESISWDHDKKFGEAERKIYKVHPSDTQVAGYVKNFKQFFFCTIRNAGHLVPFDQPEVAYDMISRFIDNRPF